MSSSEDAGRRVRDQDMFMLGLNRYAAKFLYPSSEATALDMKVAHKAAKAVRKEARLALGLKVSGAL